MLPEALANHPDAVALGSLLTAGKFELGELTVEVAPENILPALTLLKNELKFEKLSTLTGVDRYPAEPRFEVVYHLQSISLKKRIRVKARVSGDNPRIASVTAIYRAADWYERETFDFFGITFEGHPELKRIMMPEDWVGYPLRKDYPVTGTRY